MRTIIIFLLIVVCGALIYHSYSRNFIYHKYSSKDPELSITMDYVAGWHYSEYRASYANYVQVIFYEPEREDKDVSFPHSIKAAFLNQNSILIPLPAISKFQTQYLG